MQRKIVIMVVLGALLGVVWAYPIERLSVMEVSGPKMYLERMFISVNKKGGVEYGQAPAYKTNEMVRLKLDVYQPEGDTRSNRPAIILVHGGGFVGGSRGIYEEEAKGGLFGWGKYFAERGYVVFSVDYRVGDNLYELNDPELPVVIAMATSDVRTSVLWVRQHASEYRVNPDKIAVGGNSAGAVLALYAAYGPGVSAAPIAAVISLAGAMMVDDVGQVRSGSAPAIMFAGTDDKTVPYAWSLNVKDKLLASGVRVDWYSYPGAGHEVAGYTQVAPQIAQFLYSAMRLDGSVALPPSTPSPTPSPSQVVQQATPKPVLSTPKPTPTPSLTPKPTQMVTPVPTRLVTSEEKVSTMFSPEPTNSQVVKPSATVKPVKTKVALVTPSPTAESELERMPPDDFVWEGKVVTPEIETSEEVEDTQASVVEVIWQKLQALVENLF